MHSSSVELQNFNREDAAMEKGAGARARAVARLSEVSEEIKYQLLKGLSPHLSLSNYSSVSACVPFANRDLRSEMMTSMRKFKIGSVRRPRGIISERAAETRKPFPN